MVWGTYRKRVEGSRSSTSKAGSAMLACLELGLEPGLFRFTSSSMLLCLLAAPITVVVTSSGGAQETRDVCEQRFQG